MGKLRLKKTNWFVHKHRAYKSWIKQKPMSIESISKILLLYLISKHKLRTQIYFNIMKKWEKNQFDNKLQEEFNKH